MLSQLLRTQRRMRRMTIGTVAALSLLMAIGLTADANHTLGGPSEYRDC